MSNYTANQPYHNSSRAFESHPTILVPAFNQEDGMLHFNCRPYTLSTSTFGDPAFLLALSQDPLQPVVYTAAKQNWRYDSRHTAQAIPPCFYLGPIQSAKDPEFITNNHITMVISVRSAKLASKFPKLQNPAKFESCKDIQTMTFDVDGPYDIATKIKPVLKRMTDHMHERARSQERNSPGKILVVCESGNERSPVLVAAWIMLVYGISWSDSLNMIHAFRFSVCLDSNMNDMLRTFEGLLKAEFDADRAQASKDEDDSGTGAGLGARTSVKRRVDDVYDSDETMTEDDVEMAARPGLAPFVDRL